MLNELSGASLVTPWSDSNATYRQNALTFIQELAALGAHPVLLVAKRPYTGGDALVWWQQAAAAAELVREDYVPANVTWKQGAILGSRNLRESYRQAVGGLHRDGDPAEPDRAVTSFATTRGFGGRNGLEPADGVVPGGEVAGARAAAGRLRDGHRLGLVVGLGRVERRGAGSGQAVRPVRVALGAVARALRRAEGDRARRSTRRARTGS